MYTFGTKSERALVGVFPPLVKVLRAAIVNSPIDFGISEGVRSQATQVAYYAKGRTAPGPVITNADGVRNKSNHQVKDDGYGHAVDLYPYVNGQLKYDDERDLETIARHIQSVGASMGVTVVWGGDWHSLVDKPHFEVV